MRPEGGKEGEGEGERTPSSSRKGTTVEWAQRLYHIPKMFVPGKNRRCLHLCGHCRANDWHEDRMPAVMHATAGAIVFIGGGDDPASRMTAVAPEEQAMASADRVSGPIDESVELFASSSPPLQPPARNAEGGREIMTAGGGMGLDSGDTPHITDDQSSTRWTDFISFATPLDFFLTAVAITGCLSTGMGIPIVAMIIRDIINEGFALGPQGIDPYLIYDMALRIIYTGAGLFASAFIANSFLALAAARQGEKVRITYLAAILKQDASWLDRHRVSDISSSYEKDCATVQAAVGDKLGYLFQNLSTVLGSLAIAIGQGWKMTLVLVAALPIVALISFATRPLSLRIYTLLEAALLRSGSLCEQALGGMRTLASFCGEEGEAAKVRTQLFDADVQGSRLARINGLVSGLMASVIFLTFAVGLWMGADLQRVEEWNPATGRYYNGADSALIFVCILLAAYHSAQVPPALAAVHNGQAAASRITRLRARKPRIDASSVDGRIVDLSSAPRLSLENVRFAYPTRGDAEVLKGVSLTVPPGKTLALVGQSGSGKSTVVQLVMRLYDPSDGCVLLDGEDVRLFNVRWLRRQIGLVSQEPVLFSASVFENVRITCREATRGDVEEACKKASVHDFIRGLSQGYDTMCGERGSQMSGGQKQRIAIARAVVSNPRILLLDEATSALDTESERLVQAALNQNFGGKTVISIAHRMSTIRGAHVIAVMDKGRIVEEGTHEELSAKEGGVYAGYISSGNHHAVSSDALEANVELLDIVASPRSPNPRPEMPSSPISTAFGTTAEYRRKSSLLGVIGSAAVGGDPGNGLMPPHDFGADADQGGRIRPWHAGGWVWIRSMSLCMRENPLWSALALLSLVAGGSVAPLLCWILVEGVTILFRCFLIDMPTMFGSWRGEDYQLISFFGFGIPCESSCLLDFAVSGSPMGKVGGARCSLRNWDTLCMDFGSFSVKFWDVASRGQCYDEMMVEVRPLLWGVGGLGIGASISTCVQVLSLGLLSRRLGSRLREMSYASLLRQRIGFFDLEENASGTLAGRIMADAACVESAVSNVLGSVLVNMICVIGSIVVGFTRGYLLTAICLVVFPAKFLVMVIWSFIRYLTETNIKAYKASSAVTHETISSVRTINAIAAHREMLAVCQELVSKAGRGAVGVAFAAGIGHGFTYLVQFCLYFTAFVAGARLMVWNGYGFDDVIKVFLSIAFAGIAAQLVGIRLADLAKAKAALARLFALSDLAHGQDRVAEAEHPASPDSISGSLELRNVVFSYPSRPSATVLNGINITFPAGETVALVGSSGSGKSTVIQLIERFYDPISGSITLDGRDLSSFPLKWLRTQMSLVSQEPVLFYESVSDSIRRGKRGLECSQEEVIEAAKKANAHNFVSSLPKGYDTMCGERGSQMSGGQKQRIAIARAVVSNPRILLLDEATSALDTESERLVQAALDTLMGGRTVVMIAHRMSTVMGAHRIIVMSKGAVVEQGTHAELLANKEGAYSTLVKTQLTSMPS